MAYYLVKFAETVWSSCLELNEKTVDKENEVDLFSTAPFPSQGPSKSSKKLVCKRCNLPSDQFLECQACKGLYHLQCLIEKTTNSNDCKVCNLTSSTELQSHTTNDEVPTRGDEKDEVPYCRICCERRRSKFERWMKLECCHHFHLECLHKSIQSRYVQNICAVCTRKICQSDLELIVSAWKQELQRKKEKETLLRDAIRVLYEEVQ